MAAVDNFLLIFREVANSLLRPEELLMVGGGVYTLVQGVRVCALAGRLLYVHGLSAVWPRRNVRHRFGEWAVVTGSTHGIGKAYARQLASQGMNIFIIALDDKLCKKVAQQIAIDYNVTSIGFGVDFNHIEDLYDEINDILDEYEIGILINNAGVNYDVPNHFLDIPKERFINICNVNILTTTMMTNMLLPKMLKRRRGAIVNVSSGASLKPQPQLAVFTASEAYIDSFTTALSYEYRPGFHNGYHDVIIQCLTPFYVSTKMTAFKKQTLFIPSPEKYAKSALCTLGWSTRTTGYWPHSIQLWLCNWICDGAWMWFIYNLNTSFRLSITSSSSSNRRGSGH